MQFGKVLILAFFTGVLILPAISSAAEFTSIQPDKSSLTFGFKQMGVSMTGRFKQFSAQMNFDPSKPSNAKAKINIDLASIDVGSDEGNDEVVGKQWFDIKAHPKASFVTSSVKLIGGNQYEVAGALTIKGRTNLTTAPVTVTIQGKAASFDGSFIMKRTDFSIGEGPWSAFDIVANEVQINFHLVTTTTM